MPHYLYNDNLYHMCVALFIYIPKLHNKHKEEIKRAYYLVYRLLSNINNDFILKFSLFRYYYINSFGLLWHFFKTVLPLYIPDCRPD